MINLVVLRLQDVILYGAQACFLSRTGTARTFLEYPVWLDPSRVHELFEKPALPAFTGTRYLRGELFDHLRTLVEQWAVLTQTTAPS